MGDKSHKPGEMQAPQNSAEDNPWYLLATLYGVAEGPNTELKDKNRTAWNRYFAAPLDAKTRQRAIKEERHDPRELVPFQPQELIEITTAFVKRKGSAKNLPAADAPINFSNVRFNRDVAFEGYVFVQSSFRDATFSGDAVFMGATFSGSADFGGATFSEGSYFSDASFSSWVSFEKTSFSGRANFLSATFFQDAVFKKAAFSFKCTFKRVIFFNDAEFADATFFNLTTFENAIFYGTTSFRKATFDSLITFLNVEMKGATSFEGATFGWGPPRFFGANLHEDTVWRGIVWPKPKDRAEAGRFLDAYERLKLEADRLKKHEEELNFFALELQSRRVLQGLWRGLPIALYGFFSDYGRSYTRPLCWLIVTVAAGAWAFRAFDAFNILESSGLSFANTFAVLGFRKEFFDTHFIEGLPFWIKAVAGTQTIAGVVLLFLFGLGIRNRFRMK